MNRRYLDDMNSLIPGAATSVHIARPESCLASGEHSEYYSCTNAIDGVPTTDSMWGTERDAGVWLMVNFTKSYMLHTTHLMQVPYPIYSINAGRLTFSNGETTEVGL